MRRKLLSLFLVLMLLLLYPAIALADDMVISIPAIDGVTAPVTGSVPVSTITETAEYTGTVTWNGNPASFPADTEYTATITVTPKAGYKLDGVPENFFTVAGATATNAAGSGVITAVFPKTAPDATPTAVSISAIGGITAPVTGSVPVSTITETAEYTGTVTWNGNPESFAADTEYTATITVTPKAGYKLDGVPENFFTVAGAIATNAAGTGVITAVFPKTAPNATSTVVLISAIGGVTAPATGAAPVSAITETAEYTGTVVWSGNPTIFAADTAYTATITLNPKTGYKLDGVPENFFTVAGAAATNAIGSGVITAVFPKTALPLPAPKFVSAGTNLTGNTVTIAFDKPMADPSADAGCFSVKIHGSQKMWYSIVKSTYTMSVNHASLNADSTKIDLTLTAPLQRGDVVTIDYTPGNVKAADTSVLEAFDSQPVTNAVPVSINTNLPGTWQIFDHIGNWQEDPYESETPNSDDPRGHAYNRHIVINGSTVYFYGNGMMPFKDFLYLPSIDAAAKSFTFNLDLTGIKFHSMEGGGFLFNTKVDGGQISGYCVLFQKKDIYDSEGYKYVYEANLYEIKSVDVNNFHDGVGGYYNISAEPQGITLLGSFPLVTGDKHSIVLEASSNTVDMWDGNTKLINNVALPDVFSNGVGIIGSYQQHDCNELSYFVFSNLNIQGVADLTAVRSEDQANLTFTAPEGAASVSVEQSTDAGVTWATANASAISNTSTTSTVSGLVVNNTYYFRLKITGGKYNGYSRIATVDYKGEPVVTPPQVPAPVSNPAPVLHYKLTIDKTGEGTVSPGIGEFDYTGYYNKVVLSATPAEGYTFDGWKDSSGNSIILGEGNILTLSEDKSITAVFKKIESESAPAPVITPEPTPASEPTPTPTPTPAPEPTPVPVPEPTPEPEPSPEPTPAPTPAPEPEPAPAPTQETPEKLPKTGGVPAGALYGLGGLITAAGLYFRRKK